VSAARARSSARTPASDGADSREAARRIEAPVVHGLLVLVTLALVAFGLVMVYSASSARAAIAQGDPAYYLKRQAVYAAFGLLLFVVLARLDYRTFKRFAGPFLCVSLVLLAFVLVAGRSVNGARRWIELGPVTVQPSELAKIALAVWVAAFLARKPAPATLGALLRPVGLVTGLAALLVLAEPDLGTAIAFAIVVGAIVLVSGTRLRVLATAGGLTVGLVLLVSWLTPYRRARLITFLDPWADPQGAGFQAVQAQIALGSGGLFGHGLGESVQKVYYLPEASTDMIFAIVGEELGLVGATAVILAFVLFGYAGFRIALACRDPFGKRLGAALTALVCGQAAVNLGAVLGFAPLTGVPLPFVSAGGSSLVISLAAVGILLNIAWSDAGTRRATVPDRSRGDGGTRAARARGGGGAAGARRPRELRRAATR
jgi:cell division protein FtsW